MFATAAAAAVTDAGVFWEGHSSKTGGSLFEDLVDFPLAFARFEVLALPLALADCVVSFLLPSVSFDWGRETVGEAESLPCLRGAACRKTGADSAGFTPGRATCVGGVGGTGGPDGTESVAGLR